MSQRGVRTQSTRLDKCQSEANVEIWTSLLFHFTCLILHNFPHNFLMLTLRLVLVIDFVFPCISVSGKYKKIFFFLNRKSEDCCINQNFKNKRRNICEGGEGRVSSGLQKSQQSLEAFCSDSQGWYLPNTNNLEQKVKAFSYLCKSPMVLRRPLKQQWTPELAYHLLLTNPRTKCLFS